MDPSSLFLKEGILGAIVVVEAVVIVYLFRLLIGEKEKRLQDATQDREKYSDVIGNFSRTSELLLAKMDGKEKV